MEEDQTQTGAGAPGAIPPSKQAVKDEVLAKLDALRANVEQFLTPQGEGTDTMSPEDSLLAEIEGFIVRIQEVQGVKPAPASGPRQESAPTPASGQDVTPSNPEDQD